ncbi:MAG TPA: UDP-N-acetylmuramoyl-L-alanyl-D-glutamate--2,6-diaminopimelate ligase [Candidatus Dormibacteraeota bacterium]|nr:UDP-N-acetylmuramoyl-L-alanyl-D-glutamate--2,6-diaminopimelate ligase [Candidatus Dormibacteraeota bacterium]
MTTHRGRTISRLIEDAEPPAPKPALDLVRRLEAAGLVRGARLGGRPIASGDIGEVRVRGPVEDSRRVRPGSVFVAIPGEHVDGHGYVAAAVESGASLAIVGQPVDGVPGPQLVVTDVRRALAEAACWWYGDPSLGLGVIGVTGTDGKTTTSFLTVAALEAAGLPSGLVGTVDLRVGGLEEPTPEHVTTPAAPELQRLLRAMVDAGDEAAVVETTSHGLALERVAGVAYDAAVFTNLTHEHLELHGTFEAYRAAKLRLFERLGEKRAAKHRRGGGGAWPRVGVVNRDDGSASWFMSATLASGARLVTYGADRDADVRATRVHEDASRLRVAYEAPRGGGELELRLAGRFNAHNALAVVALGEGLGLDPVAVRAGLEATRGVPGRMERVDLGQPFGVVVDYAHSPASLSMVLDLLAPIAAARGGGLIAVFGSAGERDRGKRPMMGRIAGERCRVVVATDEDPRGEPPESIVEEIAAGAEAAGRRRGVDLLLIPDRSAAIAAAFERARPGDIVLLAGKGHEATILYDAGPRPWDERAEAESALRAMGYVG